MTQMNADGGRFDLRFLCGIADEYRLHSPGLPPQPRDDVAQTLLSVLRPEPDGAGGLQSPVVARPETEKSVCATSVSRAQLLASPSFIVIDSKCGRNSRIFFELRLQGASDQVGRFVKHPQQRASRSHDGLKL